MTQTATSFPFMIIVWIAVIAAQLASTPAPSASPTLVPRLAPSWVAAPLEKTQYAHYVRREQDGTDSGIFAWRQVCDCQPDRAMQMLQDELGKIQGVSLHQETLTACGQPAYRFVATGLADPTSSRHNLEVVMFRLDKALYTLEYIFDYPAPMADAESALLSLCPSS